ncbi:MAG TPA: hypothetical protein VG056_06925 [Pirellulales bacterium]|nr:hypothetical protein [Pirellulales bacterium]
MSTWGRIAGIAVLGTTFLAGSTLLTSGIIGIAPTPAHADEFEHHPHLHHAIRELRDARKELKDADHDFGGHRADALKAVDVAIEQLETALKYDRR